mmetsp:Transcript_13169/g.55653  ORF Transcript_13169/g.55653 Transcript_13169/m.55653 type:complete len:399 (+) Transcript_13169:145-1341(+)
MRQQKRRRRPGPKSRGRVVVPPPQRPDDLRPTRRAVRSQRVRERRVGVVRAAQQHERRAHGGVVVVLRQLPGVKRHHRGDGIRHPRRAPHRAPRAERVPGHAELPRVDNDPVPARLEVREHARGVDGGDRAGGSVWDASQKRTRGDHPPRREVLQELGEPVPVVRQLAVPLGSEAVDGAGDALDARAVPFAAVAPRQAGDGGALAVVESFVRGGVAREGHRLGPPRHRARDERAGEPVHDRSRRLHLDELGFEGPEVGVGPAGSSLGQRVGLVAVGDEAEHVLQRAPAHPRAPGRPRGHARAIPTARRRRRGDRRREEEEEGEGRSHGAAGRAPCGSGRLASPAPGLVARGCFSRRGPGKTRLGDDPRTTRGTRFGRTRRGSRSLLSSWLKFASSSQS